MERSASAIWNGSLKEGKGTISSKSGALQRDAVQFCGSVCRGHQDEPGGVDCGGACGLLFDGAERGAGQGGLYAGFD